MNLWKNRRIVSQQGLFITGEESYKPTKLRSNQIIRRERKKIKRKAKTIAQERIRTMVSSREALADNNKKHMSSRLRRIKPDILGPQDLRLLRLKANQRLGSGGYGTVFRIKYKHQDAALKLAHQSSRSIQRSFKQERNVLEILQGEAGAPRILAYCQDPPAIVMEFIPGRDFLQIVQDKGISDINKLQMLPEIGRQLQKLHQHNIVHVDFKANNIMVEVQPKENPSSNSLCMRIMDFGMAYPVGSLLQLRSNGAAWYAPEYRQKGGGFTSTSGDVYSFGYLIKHTVRRLQRPPSEKYLELASMCMRNKQRHRLPLSSALETLD
ncbi:hypothetical protein SK128_023575, partial [Halocaridina rubra]